MLSDKIPNQKGQIELESCGFFKGQVTSNLHPVSLFLKDTDDMFKRFTERARRVIILAREEAELYRHEYLGTEHILQGVVKDGGGIAVAIIQKTGADLTKLRKELEKIDVNGIKIKQNNHGQDSVKKEVVK